MRLVQLLDPDLRPRLAAVEEPRLRLLQNCESVYQVVNAALREEVPLRTFLESMLSAEAIDYDPVYHGYSDWRLQPPISHPYGPTGILVSGTGLTHRRSADNRQAMHVTAGGETVEPPMTDSMKMYQWGADGGRPEAGKVGVQPEWFYKGSGYCLRTHGEPLVVPPYAEDGGEEAELAGIYIIDQNGTPRRIGFAQGNEFSDHVMERRNYLYLAPSKLRTCSIGPEILIGASVDDLHGTVRIERGGQTVWTKDFATGEARMCHSLANLEHHHFKYQGHRLPGVLHVHFFGADAFSFGEGVRLEDGDSMEIALDGFGRPLRNPVRIDRSSEELVRVADA